MSIAVVGIGQPLRGDDGAGPEAVRLWSTKFTASTENPRIRIHILETPGLDLLNYIEAADAVVLVDAVSTGRTPGTIQVFDPMPDVSMTAAEKTAHGFGVAETIMLARKSQLRIPGRVILIGIEGAQYCPGIGLSDSVRAAISAAADTIQQVVVELGGHNRAEI